MKAIFTFVSLLALAVAQIITDGCTNFACKAVEQSVTTCDSQQSTEQAYANCLCTDVRVFVQLRTLIFRKLTQWGLQVFEINVNRCITGIVCAWNGTGNPDDGLCIAQFCVGVFPKSFRPQAICDFNCKSPFPGVGMSTNFQG